jgi:hypothetical protein
VDRSSNERMYHTARVAEIEEVGVGRMVVLLHTMPDGSSHFDWLLEREPEEAPASGGLLTWRVSRRPDEASPGCLWARRLADHRAEYLHYEGPVSGGRGDVRRLARGECIVVRDEAGEVEFRCRFEGRDAEGWQQWGGKPGGEASVWSLEGSMIARGLSAQG